MPESNKPFVVTDRRKFTKEGDLRPDAEPREPASQEAPKEPSQPILRPEPVPTPAAVAAPAPTSKTSSPAEIAESDEGDDDTLPAPTAEQMQQARLAYEATADRIDTAMRAADPGGNHAPPMNFEGVVQSLYFTAIMQLGGTTREGEKPRIDFMGARQSIDMLSVVADRTQGNLNPQETRLLESALFELRMAFLEVTDALARSAAARGGAPGGAPGMPGSPAGPTPGKSGIIL